MSPTWKQRLEEKEQVLPYGELYMSTLSDETIAAISRGEHSDPFAVLGPHVVWHSRQSTVAVRSFLPHAVQVTVIPTDGRAQPQVMDLIHPEGIFETLFPGRRALFPYQLEVTEQDGHTMRREDPYRFPSTMSTDDLLLLSAGTYYRAYEKLGAHLTEVNGVSGTVFVVWAPNARRVSVVGDFNQWDGRVHPMRLHPTGSKLAILLVMRALRLRCATLRASGNPPSP
ncbi:MAG: hypothetical protein AB7G75_08075 [Candidatus Binatia bacterium]